MNSWQGRTDGTSPDVLRWHQVVKIAGNTLPALEAGQKGIAFLGFACDEGVRRNKGRTGAAAGPEALRKMCANFPVHFDHHILVDAGDVVCSGHDLEAAQEALSVRVQQLIGAGYLPVLFGGGHEIAYGHERGIRRAMQAGGQEPAHEHERDAPQAIPGSGQKPAHEHERDAPQAIPGSGQKPAHEHERDAMLAGGQLGIINFDAHFDLRQPEAQGPTSGTGFWQMAEDRKAAGLPFHYLALGIQQNSNTRRLFDTADALGAEYLPASLFQPKYHDRLIGAIEAFIRRNDKIYLTTCLDVFAAPYAPGVSATAYNGLVPDALFLDCFRTVLRSGKLAGADIAELNPSLDPDNRTAKLAASLVFEIVMNCFAWERH